jgi:ABC-type multidrug transport system fused ATPase/permease subunit
MKVDMNSYDNLHGQELLDKFNAEDAERVMDMAEHNAKYEAEMKAKEEEETRVFQLKNAKANITASIMGALGFSLLAAYMFFTGNGSVDMEITISYIALVGLCVVSGVIYVSTVIKLSK